MTDRTPSSARDDDRMVVFAHRWMPFDGKGDGEIFAEFGVAPVVFYGRVIDILRRFDVPESDRTSHDDFLRYCLRRRRAHAFSLTGTNLVRSRD